MNSQKTFVFGIMAWICIVYLGLSNHYLKKDVKELKEIVSEIKKGE